MRIVSIALASSTLFTAACATAPPPAPVGPVEGWASPLSTDHPLVGRIWSTSDERFVTREDVVRAARQTRFVLLGEKHDNRDHHRLQAEMIQAIAENGRRPRVVFEMIPENQQVDVEAYRAGTSTSVDDLEIVLDWESSGWPEWSMYRPVFSAALEADLPIVAAMLPRARAMALARGKEKLPEDFIEKFRLDAPLPEALQTDLIEHLREGHCGHLPESMTQMMIDSQRARDAIMAKHLLASDDQGAILVAGGGHTRKDRAVPYYLAQLGNRSALAIGFAEVQDGWTDPEDYAAHMGDPLPHDFVWFTPRANDRDYCAELEEKMKSMKGKHLE